MFRATCLILLMLVAGASPVPAAAPPHRPGAWLLEEQGARHLGLGGASTALFDHVGALHSNPAGLTGVDENEVSLELGKTHAGDGWAAADAAWPFQRRTTFAFGVRGAAHIANDAVARLDRDGVFRGTAGIGAEEDLLLRAGVGRRFGPDLSIGGAVTGLFLDGYAGERGFQGLYGDLGFRYDSARTGLVMGGVIKNAGGAIGGGTAADPPLRGSIGVSYGKLRSTAHYFTMTADLALMEGRAPAARAGVEYWWANYLALRAGYDGTQRRHLANPYGGDWSVGLSLNFSGVLCDLAVVPARSGLGDAKIVGGLRITFGPGRSQ